MPNPVRTTSRKLNLSETRELQAGRYIMREKLNADTGERYHVEVKLAWGKLYYRLPDQLDWHTTPRNARRGRLTPYLEKRRYTMYASEDEKHRDYGRAVFPDLRTPHQIRPDLNERRRGHASFALFLSERGWSQNRIARELRCSKTTVQVMLSYARAKENR